MGTFCSHAIFLVLREPNAGGTSTCVDSEPNTITSCWRDAGVRRPLRENPCGECLHHFNFGTGTGPSGGPIRTRGQAYF